MRQSQNPVPHRRTIRSDSTTLMSSGYAGKVVPVGYIPLLRGDSCSGKMAIDIELAEMPKPLLNAVHANVQAWYVPKLAYPHFQGEDEFSASYTGTIQPKLGGGEALPPNFFEQITDNLGIDIIANSEFAKTLGLHLRDRALNADLLDAYQLVYNFRLNAHSTKIGRRDYTAESVDSATALGRAFWPSGRWSQVKPDYEESMIVGDMAMDVQAGRIPVRGMGRVTGATPILGGPENVTDVSGPDIYLTAADPGHSSILINTDGNGSPDLNADMRDQQFTGNLADIDRARGLKAFAEMRQAYVGNNSSGFINDDGIVATLMAGLKVPAEQFKRPWLLDSKRVVFGFGERHATDGDNLTKSVTQGRLSTMLSLNVPYQDTGGMVIFTVEVLPERIDERASDEFHHIQTPSELPEPIRDTLRTVPVDEVKKRRLDAAHTDPNGIYGYEPMNNVWNRNFTRLGGVFFQPDPNAEVDEGRSGIWECDVIDREYDVHHWLAPQDFPNDVFSDTLAPSFEFVCRHSVQIAGITQIGDRFDENNFNYPQVESQRMGDGTYISQNPVSGGLDGVQGEG